MTEDFWHWIVWGGKLLGGGILAVLVLLNPYAATGAAFGCCFFMAFPSASRGWQRVLYGVFSWGIGYGAGVFFFGEGPPYSPKAMLVSASFSALGALIFIAWGRIIGKGGKFPQWVETLLDIVFPFRSKGGNDDAN